MPRVTAIEPQRFDQDRLNVHLDGAYAFSLSAAVAEETGLRVGAVLDAADVASLHDRDRHRRALDRALNFLAHRPRSEREVRDNLARAGYEEEYAESAVARLRDWGYLSDADFARFWVENRSRHRPRGDRLLALELRRMGVDRTVAEAAIDESGTDDVEAARQAGRRKAQQLAALDEPTFRQRLGAFLARRGFDWDTIKPAVAALRAEVSAETDG